MFRAWREHRAAVFELQHVSLPLVDDDVAVERALLDTLTELRRHEITPSHARARAGWLVKLARIRRGRTAA